MAFFSAAVLLLAGAFNLYFEIRKRRRCSVPAKAAVVEIRRSRTGGGTACIPVLEYSVLGKAVRGNLGVVRPKKIDRYKPGTPVPILYDPEKPEDFRIAGKNGVLLFSVVLILWGIVGFVLQFVS